MANNAEIRITSGQTATNPAVTQNNAIPDEPFEPLPDTLPDDPARDVYVGTGATHVVVQHSVGAWRRGDRLGPDDFPNGRDGILRLARLKPPAIRKMNADELAAMPPPTNEAEEDTENTGTTTNPTNPTKPTNPVKTGTNTGATGTTSATKTTGTK